MNFQSLITDSGNILHRLGKFLGLKEPWDDDTALPEVTETETLCSKSIPLN